MKSFRLCSLTVFTEANNQTTKHDIPLFDGLIINKENPNDYWLIEGLIDEDFSELFNTLKEKNETMLVEATITHKNNPPASFVAKVRVIRLIKDHLQLLLEAKRLTRKDTFSEMILKDLIDRGISGENLLKEFKRIKKERGVEFRKLVENDIKEMKEKNYL